MACEVPLVTIGIARKLHARQLALAFRFQREALLKAVLDKIMRDLDIDDTPFVYIRHFTRGYGELATT